ncbi:MAG: ankyrin repeat domain-containing protein [Cyanobacteria bacterium J06600_6]
MGKEQKHVELVKTLMDFNADITSCSPSGVSALMIAANTGNIGIVEMLLEAGANPDAVDTYGDMALDKAAYWGHQDIFDYLLIFTPCPERLDDLQKTLASAILRQQRLKQRKTKYFHV